MFRTVVVLVGGLVLFRPPHCPPRSPFWDRSMARAYMPILRASTPRLSSNSPPPLRADRKTRGPSTSAAWPT